MTVTTDNSQTLVNALVEIERLNDRLLMVEAILAGNGALITGLKAEVARLEPLQYRQAPCHHQGSPSMTALFITQENLADRWLISEATLERDRSLKQGVKFLKIGGLIRYRLQDVIDYEQSCVIETKPIVSKKRKEAL